MLCEVMLPRRSGGGRSWDGGLSGGWAVKVLKCPTPKSTDTTFFARKALFAQNPTFRDRAQARVRRAGVIQAASACEHFQRSSWRGASLPRRQPGTASQQWRSASGGAGACLPTPQVRLLCPAAPAEKSRPPNPP